MILPLPLLPFLLLPPLLLHLLPTLLFSHGIFDTNRVTLTTFRILINRYIQLLLDSISKSLVHLDRTSLVHASSLFFIPEYLLEVGYQSVGNDDGFAGVDQISH